MRKIGGTSFMRGGKTDKQNTHALIGVAAPVLTTGVTKRRKEETKRCCFIRFSFFGVRTLVAEQESRSEGVLNASHHATDGCCLDFKDLRVTILTIACFLGILVDWSCWRAARHFACLSYGTGRLFISLTQIFFHLCT